MSRPPRFYLPTLSKGEVILDGSEAHHLLNVRRLKNGDSVELFNGLGDVAPARIVSTTRRDAVLETGAIASEPEQQATLTLGIAFPKQDRARWMVEKLTELGVHKVVPLETEFSQSSGKPINVTKLDQYVVDACKQCGRNRLMTVSSPEKFLPFVSERTEHLYLAASSGEPVSATLPNQSGRDIAVLIGPEGGFSDSEGHFAIDAGAYPVSFSGNVLRVETAAIAAALMLLPPQA